VRHQDNHDAWSEWSEETSFTTLAAAKWQKTIVDSESNVDYDTSLAFDPLGHPAISYYDATNENLKYAHFDGTSWNRGYIT
jgi:hypothetical protein